MTGYPLRVELAARAGAATAGTALVLVAGLPGLVEAVATVVIAIVTAAVVDRLVLQPYLDEVTRRPPWDPHARPDGSGAALRGALIPALVTVVGGVGFPFLSGLLLGDALAAGRAQRRVRAWEATADAELLRLGGRLWEDVWYPGSMLWVGHAPHGTVLATGDRPPAG